MSLQDFPKQAKHTNKIRNWAHKPGLGHPCLRDVCDGSPVLVRKSFGIDSKSTTCGINVNEQETENVNMILISMLHLSLK